MHRDEWMLREVSEADVGTLMQWFPNDEDIKIWGGPSFRSPFTRDTFFEDIHWGQIASFGLFDSNHTLTGFGQLYDREQRIHLARLVVDPARRGAGLGRRLTAMLMEAGCERYSYEQFSLFVYRDNEPAYQCYRSLGFEVTDYPRDMPLADVCDFLVRTV
jgi:ribosomal protein S18 acetylase RimI-like enzyme